MQPPAAAGAGQPRLGAATRRHRVSCQRRGVDPAQLGRQPGQLGRGAVVQAARAMTQQDHLAHRDHRWLAGQRHQRRRTVPGEHGEVHVGGLAGVGPRPVEVVGVPVDEPQAGRTQLPAQRGDDAEQDAAVPADHQRPPARQVVQCRRQGVGQGTRGPDGLRECQHTGAVVPPGAVDHGAGVAEVPAHQGGQPRAAQRGRCRLLAAAGAGAVPRSTQEEPAGTDHPGIIRPARRPRQPTPADRTAAAGGPDRTRPAGWVRHAARCLRPGRRRSTFIHYIW